jgi:hypothetical protein
VIFAALDAFIDRVGTPHWRRCSCAGKSLAGRQNLTFGPRQTGKWHPRTPPPWQRCDTSGGDCRNIADATGRTYGVRSVDVDHCLRALVTAITAAGASTIASSPSAVVVGNTSTVTTTNTTSTTVQGNRALTIRFISLRWFGRRLYARFRFRVCDDKTGRIGLTARHNKARALPYTRRLAVVLTAGCGRTLGTGPRPSAFGVPACSSSSCGRPTAGIA